MSNSGDSSDRRKFLAAGLKLAGTAMVLPAMPLQAAEQPAPSIWTDRVVLVTGGSSGVGKETARTLSGMGAKVIFCARREDRGREVAKKIKESGGEAFFVKADISSISDVQHLFEEVEKRFGKLDVAVNCVGNRDRTRDFCSDPIKTFTNVLQSNLDGNMYCLQREIDLMRKGKSGGAIVNILSAIVGKSSHMTGPAYTASKYALWGLTKALAKRYTAEGIRINCISPAHLEGTDPHATLDPLDSKFGEVTIINKPLITRKEVVETIMWLCSDASSALNGTNIVLDHGYFG